MPEPTPADVAAYSQGRLPATGGNTELLLAGALAAARAYCGWHVTPVIEDDVITLDGPGSPLLVLPTLRMTALTELSEDGAALALDTVEWSGRGLVRKTNRACWTGKFRGVTAKITHGFAEAPDWNAAVLSFVDRAAQAASGAPIAVGPFRWADDKADGSAFTTAERSILELYRLERPA